MSSIPFAFSVEKLNKFVNGDIGIADTIHKAQISPILAAIPYPKDKEIFLKLQEPNRKAGIWAIEQTVISSMLESQKPFVELAKICLEMFGSIEVVVAMLVGGPHPENIPNSFSSGQKESAADMKKFKTGQEPEPPLPPGPPPIPPDNIFLGKYMRGGFTGNVNPVGSGPERGEFYPGYYWTQYQNYNEFFQVEDVKLQKAIVDVPPDVQQDIIDGRFSSIGDEWQGMLDENQLKANHIGTFGPGNNLFKYFKPIEISYLNNVMEIDVEGDYDIKVDTINQYNDIGAIVRQDFYIYATIKPEAKPPNPQASQPAQPPVFVGTPVTLLLQAIKYFLKKVLPIIIKKLIPVIVALQKLLTSPAEFIGLILMEKLKEYFEMLDPALKSKPKDDEIRNKYYSGDTFVADGIAAIDVGILKMTLGIKDGLPSFKQGAQPPPPGVKEQPTLKKIANMVALPINFLKGILDAFKDLLKNLFIVPKLPVVMADFISFKFVKDLMSMEKMLEFLGAVGGDVTKIPFLAIPSVGAVQLVPDMIKAFLKMIVHFLNGFIGMPNTILNVELVPKIPVPE
jgi:hypothetical protein